MAGANYDNLKAAISRLMSPSSLWPRWIGSVLVFGVVGMKLTDLLFPGWLDHCSIAAGVDTSANVPLGWAVAAVASVLPLLLFFFPRRKLSTSLALIPISVCVVEIVLWIALIRTGEWPCK